MLRASADALSPGSNGCLKELDTQMLGVWGRGPGDVGRVAYSVVSGFEYMPAGV
jgi:hypothetical protein